MVDRNKELAINTVILGIGQLIPKFLAIVLLPLLTSYLTTEEYGNYDLILSIASLLIPVVTMQIQQAVFRYLLAFFLLGKLGCTLHPFQLRYLFW